MLNRTKKPSRKLVAKMEPRARVVILLEADLLPALNLAWRHDVRCESRNDWIRHVILEALKQIAAPSA